MPAVGDQHRGGPVGSLTANMAGVNPFEEMPRRINEYTAQEIASLQARLDKQLGPEYISSRPGAGGQKVHYLAADKCINLANEVFGFNGWSSSIQNIQIDFVDENPQTGKITLGLSVIVRVTLKDGTYHEDIGYGHIENCKGKAAAFEKAKKEGTTDALKRTLRTFGNVLGNCVYDKEYLGKVTRLKVAPTKWDVGNLHRHADYAPARKEPEKEIVQKVIEDVDLPPNVDRSMSAETLSMEVDAEFGSDVFDEADFVATTMGNPDEIALDPEPQQPNPASASANARGPTQIVTPSKPERDWGGSNISRAQRSVAQQPSVTGNDSITQKTPTSYVRPQNGQQQNSMAPPLQQSTNSQEQKGNVQAGSNIPPTAGFYSAKAADILRENPTAAPKFDPHAESPSIRKTAGFDHTKSIPVSKPMLAGVSPATNNTRDFIHPATDTTRRIGAPAGSMVGSPLSRAPSTSSYRPLTRPATVSNQGTTTNPPAKRPPLNDVTNEVGADAPITMGTHDPKRPRVTNEAGRPNPALP